MSSSDLSFNHETFSSRMIGINIENLVSLNNGIHSATKEKMNQIFITLSSCPNDIPKNKKEIVEKLIDACKCKEYTTTRILGIIERKVEKTTHIN